jgi:hypothetical protein
MRVETRSLSDFEWASCLGGCLGELSLSLGAAADYCGVAKSEPRWSTKGGLAQRNPPFHAPGWRVSANPLYDAP